MKDCVKRKIKHFVDDKGTTFIRGPFEIDGEEYMYKLIDKDGEDYCTESQLDMWNVEIEKIIEE